LEKPKTEKWVSGGFFLFEPAVFNYLDEDCILEQGPLQKLASEGELFAYRHHGFWQPMDTFRETQMLNEMWMQRQAPWCNWTEGK
jgi:glucose-1-phosphate cytidylyltransferase